MNSTFFHKSVRIRRHHNLITSILGIEGNPFSKKQQIDSILLNHFSFLGVTLTLGLLIKSWILPQ